MDNIFSVSALTDILRDALEKRLPFVWVRGEIGSISRSPAGHIYFALKDSRSQLQCVWFAARQRSNAPFDPLTGEVYDTAAPPIHDALRQGMEILCAGGISVYAPRGQYQLKVELVHPVGEGQLGLRFEKLKRKLAEAGYFAMERKRPLPSNPSRIALITSPQGAAIHDFLRLAKTRGLSATTRLFPVPVQGEGAAQRIAAAIEAANSQGWAEVIALIRGGGSLEDLWAFNEEELATAIFNSKIPVLAGIGHEVDFTLSDLTADLRAATPSHAAQLLWPEQAELWQRLDELTATLLTAASRKIESAESIWERHARALAWLSPKQKLARLDERIVMATRQLGRDSRRLLEAKDAALAARAASLAALNPAAPLERGFALLHGPDGPIRSAAAISQGAAMRALLRDGEIFATVDGTKPRKLCKEDSR